MRVSKPEKKTYTNEFCDSAGLKLCPWKLTEYANANESQCVPTADNSLVIPSLLKIVWGAVRQPERVETMIQNEKTNTNKKNRKQYSKDSFLGAQSAPFNA